MPELPEVEQARRYLAAKAMNRRMGSVEVLDVGVLQGVEPNAFSSSLAGRTMTTAARRGKQMFIGLDDGTFLTIHLGMTGDLVGDGPEPRFCRIVFRFEDGTNLFYVDQRKFGAVGIAVSIEQFVAEHGLGPDALTIDRHDFIAGRLGTRRR